MSILEKLKSAGSIKATTVAESSFFDAKEFVPTNIPIINIALSGELTGGLTSGLTVIAGDSKTFKTNLGLVSVKAYLSKFKDSVCILYDSEFGITPEYLVAHGIDPNRVIHIPIEHIEQLKFDMSQRLDAISKGDKVIIFIDSVGNLASKKEVEDALEEKSAADMTRAKQLKSLFRIVTPHFTIKDIPCIVINHTYSEQGMFPKDIMSGGKGIYYSANSIFFITRAQEKEGNDVVGYTFTINIEKSRIVREKSKMKFTVMYNGGISKWSGLLDLAQELNFVVKPSKGKYSRVDVNSGEIEDAKFSESDTNDVEFWRPILSNRKFHDAVKERYKIALTSMQNFDDGDEIEVVDE